MEDKRSIKKVLKSQGDVHEKVANQSNLELPSSSLTRSPGPPHIQINIQIIYDLCFGRSTYVQKVKEITFQWNWSHVQLKSESSTIIKKVPISRTVFGAAPLFWPDGPCIQLESIRDASYDSVMTLDPLYSVAAVILRGFCLD
jgi:hypothetical protein